MHQSVRDRFMEFTTPFEARVHWMYLDVKRLVTTGVGNLIDPREHALALPFVDQDTGAPASREEIAAEWDMLKADAARLAKAGHGTCGKITRLRLSDADIDELVYRKLDEMERVLQHRFPDYDSWPADAQLGVLSMAWAMGPAFRFPNFAAAANACDWRTAAAECTINEAGNPGVAPRNVANRQLFANAAAVVENSLDPTFLYHPVVLDEQPLDQPVDQPVEETEPVSDGIEEPVDEITEELTDEVTDESTDEQVSEEPAEEIGESSDGSSDPFADWNEPADGESDTDSEFAAASAAPRIRRPDKR